jgi:hypothetical protein
MPATTVDQSERFSAFLAVTESHFTPFTAQGLTNAVPFDMNQSFWVVDPESGATLGIYHNGSFTSHGVDLIAYKVYLLRQAP